MGSPQEGTGNGKYLGSENLYRNRLGCDARRRNLLHAGTALAQDKNLTEDQIVRALAPEKKPLTRGLSTGPQTVVDRP